jgi:oligo-1,6-glucosidase/alpha-glucosidase
MHAVPWWKRTTVYQIYPRSFADANGDGIGDLAGVIQRLDYLHDLGVETLWLSPFFDSPQADFGYDIRNHFDVAPEYGSLDDLERLIGEVHARGMKIVFDMVLNHTSDQHPWFVASRSHRDHPMRDYYLWRDGRGKSGKKPPNNWRSMLGGSGWQYDAQSEQWYWASFLPFQPDLNYRNPAVKEAMLDVVRHWLDAGVDGLRLDIFNALFKDPSFADNPFSLKPIPTEDSPHGYFQRHLHTLDHPDTLAFARELRMLVDRYDPPRFVVGEVFGSPSDLKRYCASDEGHDGLHLVFLFKTLGARLHSEALRELIVELEHGFAEPLLPTWVLGNHDRPRMIHRLGGCHTKAKLLATLQLTARGVPFIYYGDEIGMRHREIPTAHALDPIAHHYRFVPQWLARALKKRGMLLNRDECRLPMQWGDANHAGFTREGATPWLAPHPEAATNNVAAQLEDADSLLHHYRRLLGLRKQSAALSAGRISLIPAEDLPAEVLGYRRVHESAAQRDHVDVLLNLSTKPRLVRGVLESPRRLVSSLRGELVLSTGGYTLLPHEALVAFA